MRLEFLEAWGELILIALAVGQAVRDDDLRRAIHRSLRVIGRNEPVLGLHDAAFGIGEVALRLAVRGAARRPRLLTWLLAPRRPALLFRRGVGPRLRLGCRLGFRLERRLGLADLGQPLRLVGHPVWQLVAALVLSVGAILRRARRPRPRNPPPHLPPQLLLPPSPPPIPHPPRPPR